MEHNEVLGKKLLLVPGAECVECFEELVGEIKQVAIAEFEVEGDLNNAVSDSVDVVLHQVKKNFKVEKSVFLFSPKSSQLQSFLQRKKQQKNR